MRSISKQSYASKLHRIKRIIVLLEKTPEYVHAGKSTSIIDLQQKKNGAGLAITNYSKINYSYKTAIKKRQELYNVGDPSLVKRLTSLNSFMRAVQEKNDLQSLEIRKHIRHIRGSSLANSKKKNMPVDMVVPLQSDVMIDIVIPPKKTISRIETTFGSKWEDLGKIIVVLTSMGKQYNPSNALITLASLKELHQAMETTNIEVALNHTALKEAAEKRKNIFNVLKTQIADVKNIIKSQFGQSSAVYKKFREIEKS